jgi:NAD(P)-dependent dehydrogenase (short-subunit alcohol dehydrogenase family)
MANQVILVTGGANGIGKGICEFLVKNSPAINSTSGNETIVIAVDIDENAGFKLVSEEPRIRFRCADVSNETEMSLIIKEITIQYGHLNGLINNAAISNPYNSPLEELDLIEWHRVLNINLTAPLLMSKLCLPLLKKARGSIVNISSTRAQQSEPNTELYSASKGGLVALTHALANSLGPEIRVNCVSPGWINTTNELLRDIDSSQHPVGRVGDITDTAAIVNFLLSEQSGFITGQNFTVDGGMTKKMIYAE